MTEIQPFVFPSTGQPVRTVAIDDGPWFVAADVCAVLAHTNTTVALAMVDDEDKRNFRRSEALNFADTFPDLRVQSANLVNESGLYTLILRSNVPGARAFKRWITHEVIPAIRRTGSYAADKPMSELEMAQRYVAALEREQQLTTKVAELAPSAHAWDVLATATGDYSVRDAAQILDRDPLISTGQNRLFATLRELGWVDDDGRPYQAQVDNGRLVRRPTSYTHPHTNEPVLTSQVRITAKGLRELHKRLGGFGAANGLVGAPS